MTMKKSTFAYILLRIESIWYGKRIRILKIIRSLDKNNCLSEWMNNSHKMLDKYTHGVSVVKRYDLIKAKIMMKILIWSQKQVISTPTRDKHRHR